MKRLLILIITARLAAACMPSPAAPITLPADTPVPSRTPTPTAISTPTQAPEPTVTSIPIVEPDTLQPLLDAVSEARLMAHVEALAAIPSRHVNAPGVEDAAELIRDAFAEIDGVQAGYDPFPVIFDDVETTQRNVIARLPGSDPTAGTVLVGAHYDSRTVEIVDTGRAPGANDNASGVAVLLELARVLSDARLPADIVFVAFSAEEIGVQGSLHYVATAAPVDAVLVLDMVGNAGGTAGEGSMRVFAAPPDTSPSQRLARTVARIGEEAVPGFDVEVQPTADRPGRYSDHIPFSQVGIPAVRLIEAKEAPSVQHNDQDTPDRISPGYLRQVAQVALASVVHLAEHPPTP